MQLKYRYPNEILVMLTTLIMNDFLLLSIVLLKTQKFVTDVGSRISKRGNPE